MNAVAVNSTTTHDPRILAAIHVRNQAGQRNALDLLVANAECTGDAALIKAARETRDAMSRVHSRAARLAEGGAE